MKKAASWIFALLLFSTPLFYHPGFLFPDQAKRAWIALILPLILLLGPLREAWQGKALAFPRPQSPLLTLFLLATISLLWAQSFWLWAPSIASLVLGLGLAIVGHWLGQSQPQESDSGWPKIALPALLGGCIAAALGLLQSTGWDPIGHPFDTKNALVTSFGNANFAAEFFAPLTGIAFLIASCERGFRAHLGMIALFLFPAYLSASGVRAGSIAALAALLTASWLLWRGFSPKQRKLLLAPWLAAILGFAAPKFVLPPSGSDAPPTRSTDTIEVRKKVYASTLRLIADFPLLGIGEGNFQAAFAPYRDPEEILLSSHGRRDPAESMVEEPHNDYLLFAAELGLLGAAIVGWLGWRVLRRAKEASHDLGRAIAFTTMLAIGVNALFRSPFTNPSSAMLFWTALGYFFATSASEGPASPRGKPLAAGIFTIFALLGYAGFRSLRSEIVLARGLDQVTASVAQAPWDPKKWEILGREYRVKRDLSQALHAYDRLLEINPQHFNARLQRGLVQLDRDNFEKAKADFAFAAKLDGENPRLLRAQALLSYRENDDLAAIEFLRRSMTAGGDAQIFRSFGTEVEKAGASARALKYYQAHLEKHPDDADTWMAMGQIFRNLGDEAESKRDFARAHRLYGIEHLRAGKPADAERQFRLYRRFAEEGDPRPDLFLAAAALARNDRSGAETAIEQARVRGAKQEQLHEPGLETLAADPALRDKLPR